MPRDGGQFPAFFRTSCFGITVLVRRTLPSPSEAGPYYVPNVPKAISARRPSVRTLLRTIGTAVPEATIGSLGLFVSLFFLGLCFWAGRLLCFLCIPTGWYFCKDFRVLGDLFAGRVIGVCLRVVRTDVAFMPGFGGQCRPIFGCGVRCTRYYVKRRSLVQPFRDTHALIRQVRLAALRFAFCCFTLPLPEGKKEGTICKISVQGGQAGLYVRRGRRRGLYLRLCLSYL